MTNSFLKSLPSHRKKDRQRKLRHQRRSGSQVVQHLKVDDDNAGEDHSQDRPFVQQPRFSPGHAEQHSSNFDESPGHDGEHSETSLLSDSSSSVVPATELQYPPVITGVTSMDELSDTSQPRHSENKECNDDTGGMVSPLSGRSGKVSDFFMPARFNSCDLKQRDVGDIILHEETPNKKLKDANVAVSNNGLNEANVSISKDADLSTSLNRRQLSQIAPEDKGRAGQEWVLTSLDIGLCIDEIKSAISSHNGKNNDDLFDDVDLESFQSTLERFKHYITVLGQPTSAEAMELKEFQPTEQVFVIFERGMDVDHCKAVFIHDMIENIVSGIEDAKRGKEGIDQTDHGPTRLHHLAGCIKITFGIHQDEDSQSHDTSTSFDTSVISISTIDNGATKLVVRRELARSQSFSEIIHQPNQHALPPFLSDVSKIFEHYCEKNALPLLSQLDSARKNLVKTRQGAIKLQKIALDLQDQLQSAKLDINEAYARQSDLEDEFSRHKYEFNRRAESFERVKEHYKMLVDQKEKELMDMKRKLEQKEFIPETTHSMVDEKLPRHQKISPVSSKREPAHDDSRHTTYFPKHGRNRSDVNEEVDGSSIKKKSRISMEPQVSALSTNEKDIVHESQSAPSSRKNVLHSNPNESESSITTEQRRQRQSDIFTQRSKRRDNKTGRNPLGSLTVNNFVGYSEGDIACRETKKAPKIDSHIRCKDSSLSKKSDEVIATASTSSTRFYSSKAEPPPVKNPHIKKPCQSVDSESYDFKYQEVVRGKDARQSLPAYECEQCRKFNDAVYAQTGADFPGRDKMVKECSRHRARHVPDLTPADFWDMEFADEK